MSLFHLVLALCMGVSLSAACGFRVFVPLLAVSLMVHFGDVHVNESLAWVGSDAALICLTIATLTEIAAYYIPVIDNALDTLAVPMAVIAGTIITSGMMPELPGVIQWGLALVAGGGSAGLISAATAGLRGGSTATTAGFGNFLVSTSENTLAVIGSAVALLAPILAAVGLILILCVCAWLLSRLFTRRPAGKAADTADA